VPSYRVEGSVWAQHFSLFSLPLALSDRADNESQGFQDRASHGS
jgi:hypothetical protein